MALPPYAAATLQSAAIAGVSNVMAQAILAHRADKAFVIDWVPVFQFVLMTCVNTPPNLLWQEFLESSFPAFQVAPTREAVASAAAGDEKALDREADEGRLVEPRLSVRNTLTKALLDQTVGAAVNTVLFSLFMYSLQEAMAHRPRAAHQSLGFLASGKAIDYGRVDWAAVVARTRQEFWGLMSAGWRFWPLVSLVNFAFVKGTEARNMVGSLAGVVWGIYMSMFAAQ